MHNKFNLIISFCKKTLFKFCPKRLIFSILSRRLLTSKNDKNSFVLHYGEGYVFNPTIIEYNENLLMIVRRVSNNIRSFELISVEVEGFKLLSSNAVNVNNRDTNWYADPRFFEFRGDRYLTYNTGHSETPNRIFIHQLDSKNNLSYQPILVDIVGARREIEKNWGFFEHEEELFAIYSFNPFVVLRFNLGKCRNISKIVGKVLQNKTWYDSGYAHKYGEIRGGSVPLKVNNLYYCFFQSHARTYFGDVYTGGVLVFEKIEENFVVVKIGNAPLITLDYEAFLCRGPTRLNKRVVCCAYTTGAFYDKEDDSFLVTYGVNDYAIGCQKFELKMVNEHLIDVERSEA